MKKIYTSLKYKKFNKKRSIREKKKKERRKSDKNNNGINTHNNYQRKRRERNSFKKRRKIILSNQFSIIENASDVLNIFHDVQKLLESGRRIYFDMSLIEKLTLDALLYMLSIFNSYKIKGIKVRVRGNMPLDDNCSSLLIDSGFFNYVHTSENIDRKRNPDVLQFQSGINIDVNIAKSVIDFCLEKLGQKPSLKSKSIYKMLIELMGNTYEHAFETREKTSKWYLFALYDKNEQKIKFSFLDAGLGIPSTIKKNYREKIIILFNKYIKDNIPIDSKLIKSALDGKFRTRTNKGYRGKGLPSIYANLNDKNIADLRIISNKGNFNNEDGLEDLAHPFNGTLYTWDFV